MRALGIALALLLLAACTEPPGTSSNADRDRLAVMQSEALLKRAAKEPYAEAGFRVSEKLQPHRSKIIATLASPVEVEVARKEGAEAVSVLHDTGWTVFHVRCDGLSFVANAYKVVSGVSYYAEVDGAIQEVKVSVVLQMRAPYSKEPTSDLFADRPPALTDGKSCLETHTTGVSDGTPIVLDELGPDPDGAPKPNGHR